jgi:hypothetical protein
MRSSEFAWAIKEILAVIQGVTEDDNLQYVYALLGQHASRENVIKRAREPGKRDKVRRDARDCIYSYSDVDGLFH